MDIATDATAGPILAAAEVLGRREVLKKALAVGGMGVAATTLATTAPALGAATAAGASTASLIVDTACLGETFRWVPAPGAGPADMRGSTFSVEGAIYPAGTVTGSGFDPASATPLGTWFCHGWILITHGRPSPHVMSMQEYVLGDIRPNRLFPPDQLVSNGLEGADDTSQPSVRAVVGGTGRYAGASGTVVQHITGTNTTRIMSLGGIPAPNFRFEFSLR